jgi:hypothetical protein
MSSLFRLKETTISFKVQTCAIPGQVTLCHARNIVATDTSRLFTCYVLQEKVRRGASQCYANGGAKGLQPQPADRAKVRAKFSEYP